MKIKPVEALVISTVLVLLFLMALPLFRAPAVNASETLVPTVSIQFPNTSISCWVYYDASTQSLVGLRGGIISLNTVPTHPQFQLISSQRIPNPSMNLTIYTFKFDNQTYLYHSQGGLAPVAH